MKWDGISPLYRGDEPSEIAISTMIEAIKADPVWDHIETATQRRAVAKSLIRTLRVFRNDGEARS